MMTMKFSGVWAELRDVLEQHGIVGSWHREPNGVFLLRCPDGANLHWASGNKKLWFDGKPASKRRLTQGVATVLHLLLVVD